MIKIWAKVIQSKVSNWILDVGSTPNTTAEAGYYPLKKPKHGFRQSLT